MSAYNIVRLLYVVLFLGLLALDYFLLDLPWWIYLALSLLLMGVVVAGSASLSLNFFTRSYTRLPTRERKIALTFDDGPSAIYTPQVLELLEQYGAKATFFCIGKRMAEQPELVKEIVVRGHQIGNHSYEHGKFFPLQPVPQLEEEIKKTNQLIRELVGRDCHLFRPPYGVMNPRIARAARKCEMKVVGWSIRSFDTRKEEPGKVVERVISRLKPGAVVLLHDDRANTVQILKEILEYGRQQKYAYALADEIII